MINKSASPWKPFQLSLLLVGKAGAHPSEATYGALIKGRLQCLDYNH